MSAFPPDQVRILADRERGRRAAKQGCDLCIWQVGNEAVAKFIQPFPSPHLTWPSLLAFPLTTPSSTCTLPSLFASPNHSLSTLPSLLPSRPNPSLFYLAPSLLASLPNPTPLSSTSPLTPWFSSQPLRLYLAPPSSTAHSLTQIPMVMTVGEGEERIYCQLPR